MSQSIYSYYGSRLHLILDDELADRYNRFMKAWYDAQQRHHEFHEREWDPKTESLMINFEPEDKKAYDDIGRVINLLIEINGSGLELSEEECTADYLVRIEKYLKPFETWLDTYKNQTYNAMMRVSAMTDDQKDRALADITKLVEQHILQHKIK